MGFLTKKAKTGRKQGASPLNGSIPPEETRFKPGQSGNPNGRPVSRPFKEALDKALKNGNLETVTQSLVKEAAKGNVAAIKEIAERLDGKVDQAHKISPDSEPLRVVHHIVGFGDDA